MNTNDVMSVRAADLIKIMCAFGGYDRVDVVWRCLNQTKRKITIATVETVLQDIQDEWDNSHMMNHNKKQGG